MANNILRGIASALSPQAFNKFQQQDLQRSRQDFLKEQDAGSRILAGIQAGIIPQEEGAMALQKLGGFDEFLTQDSSPPPGLDTFGGGPPEQATMGTIISESQRQQKPLKAQSRTIVDTGSGNVVGQGFFDPASGQTIFQDGSPLQSGQIGISGVLKGGRNEFKKEIAGSIKSEQNVRKAVMLFEDVKRLVASDDFVGGTAGDALTLVNSAAAQVRQVVGSDSILRDGEVDESQLDLSKDNMNFVRRAAITNDRVDSAIIELAYIKAKTLDPAGRISDADFKFARKMIERGADKASIIKLIEDNQRRAIAQHNSDTRVLDRRSGKRSKALRLNDITGGQAPVSRGISQGGADQIADSILQEEGF